MDTAGIGVANLRQFRRDLSAMDPALAKHLRAELKGVAEVGERAMKSAVPSGPGSKKKAKSGKYAGKKMGPWASKIKAGASGSSAYITWGRNTVPYAGWMEFGGSKRQPRGGLAHRPHKKGGRFIFPTLKQLDPILVKRTEAALDRVARKAGKFR